jgi:DNA-binding transcriptional regulator YiaG
MTNDDSRARITPDEVRAIRTRLGMTQVEFAAAMGVSRQATVAEWESGHRTPSGSAVRLMELLVERAALRGE